MDRIIERAERLTAAERKIAEILAEEPQTVAFGTVAGVAKRAGTSGPSVVRLAVKLGYNGFVDLQAQVQRELADQLGPARVRIRRRPPADLLDRVAGQELDNVGRTLEHVSTGAFERAVGLLADNQRHVWILVGEVTVPVGHTLALQLGQLREGVTLLQGSEVSVARTLAGSCPGDVVVAIDIHRYERWLVDAVAGVVTERAATLVVLTDSPLSPLLIGAAESFFVSARGVGPFDSMTASLALVNALVVGAAIRLRETATPRLDAIELAWVANRSLVAQPRRAGVVAGAATPPTPHLPEAFGEPQTASGGGQIQPQGAQLLGGAVIPPL